MSTDNMQEKASDIKKAQKILCGDDFSIEVHAMPTKGISARTHGHNSYELRIVVEGEAHLRINGRQIEAKKGYYWLSPPNNLHYVIRCCEDTRIISIKFADNFLSSKVYNMLGMYGEGIAGRLDSAGLNSFSKMLNNCVETYTSSKSKLCKSLFIKNAVEAVLVILIDKCDGFAPETIDSMTGHDILEAVSYVKKHFTEELTANDMAKRLGYTPNYFSMKFKSLTGKNFIETVNDERLRLAYYMLSTMDISVNDVAEYVGYSSVAYFSRMFKKKFKNSPSTVRNLERKRMTNDKITP